MAAMHQPYTRTAWLIADCFKAIKTLLLKPVACQEDIPPGNHSVNGNTAHPLKHSIFLISFPSSNLLTLMHICVTWPTSQRPDFLVYSLQKRIAKFLIQTWSLLSKIFPGWKALNSIPSVYIPPTLICKQRSLTHHCDSCLPRKLF